MHDISGTSSAASFLSFSLSRVLADIIAGTEQPNPTTIGMKALPERPIFLISLSIKKAARAIYPLSSRKDIPRNSAKIIGRKTIIEPTPPTIPSTIRDLNQGLLFVSKASSFGIR
ncbi:MAG: hypothetical protein ACFWTK_00135 [Clostridium sp.]